MWMLMCNPKYKMNEANLNCEQKYSDGQYYMAYNIGYQGWEYNWGEGYFISWQFSQFFISQS